MKPVSSLKEIASAIEQSPMAIIYFSNDTCNVCKVLKPKIAQLAGEQFPKAEMFYVDTLKNPDIAGQFRVFTIPTIDIYVQSKEHARFSRNVTMHEFERALKKPYMFLFSENTFD